MSPRVLVVEPHDQMRAVIRALFEKVGWDVVAEAADGQEAVEKSKNYNPDLVVLEMIMPLKNGVDAAAEIRQSSPSTKLLMFTIHDSEAIRNEVLRVGIDGFVAKSAPSAELLSEAERILGQH
jgi:DNA-binding NarL/FixJ family response regulator